MTYFKYGTDHLALFEPCIRATSSCRGKEQNRMMCFIYIIYHAMRKDLTLIRILEGPNIRSEFDDSDASRKDRRKNPD
jgi:hypothetical protein